MKLILAGTGNLARHLGPLWMEAGHELLGIWGRSSTRSRDLIAYWGSKGELDAAGVSHIQALGPDAPVPTADLIIVAVPDEQIAPVSERLLRQLQESKTSRNLPIIAHTSGSAALEELNPGFEQRGVWYPLQTFSYTDHLALPDFPVFLEGSTKEVLARLRAWTMDWIPAEKVRSMDSWTRLKLHLAAVMASNFPNFLWLKAFEILNKEGVDRSLMEPLLRRSLEKAMDMGPEKAQTGPARRKDHATLDKHLELLEQEPELRELYRQLSILIDRTLN